MVEVAFEFLHYFDRIFARDAQEVAQQVQ
jgi:hypothetical protein